MHPKSRCRAKKNKQCDYSQERSPAERRRRCVCYRGFAWGWGLCIYGHAIIGVFMRHVRRGHRELRDIASLGEVNAKLLGLPFGSKVLRQPLSEAGCIGANNIVVGL